MAHSAELEGVNSMVKFLLARQPRSTLALIDAQIGNRKDVGLGSRADGDVKWSSVAGRVQEILNDVKRNKDFEALVRVDAERFAFPQPATPLLDIVPELRTSTTWYTTAQLSHIANGSIAPYDITEWASSYNRHWMRGVKEQLKADRGGRCLMVRHPLFASRVFVMTQTHAHFALLLEHEVDPDSGLLKVVRPGPLDTSEMTSIELFCMIRSVGAVTDSQFPDGVPMDSSTLSHSALDMIAGDGSVQRIFNITVDPMPDPTRCSGAKKARHAIKDAAMQPVPEPLAILNSDAACDDDFGEDPPPETAFPLLQQVQSCPRS